MCGSHSKRLPSTRRLRHQRRRAARPEYGRCSPLSRRCSPLRWAPCCLSPGGHRQTLAPAVGSRALVTLLTGNGGFASNPALAPDGGSFVYVSDDRGQPDIFRRQIEGGDPVPLTQDSAAEADLVFAPNGETVYFTRQDAGRIRNLAGGRARRQRTKSRRQRACASGVPRRPALAWLTATSRGSLLAGRSGGRWRKSARAGSRSEDAGPGAALVVSRRTTARVLGRYDSSSPGTSSSSTSKTPACGR